MENIRYFEIDMSNKNDSYSICIKATHKPTKEEVKEFLKEDMKSMGYTEVDTIIETTLEEARNFYDMENENNFPVLQ